MPRHIQTAGVMVALVLLCAIALPARSAPDSAAQQLIHELDLRASAQAIRDSPGWQKPRRIVVLLPGAQRSNTSQALKPLQEVSDGVELVAVTGQAELLTAVRDADALLGYCTPEMLQAGTQLRWIQSLSAGVDRCVGALQRRDSDLLLTNMQRVHGPAIAEHVMAMLLALARDLPRYQQLQTQAVWGRGQQGVREATEISGKTMLIVGLGGIGTEIAKRAHALGMRIIAIRNSSRQGPDYVDRVGLASELPALVKQADVVVNATPLTPDTAGMFDAAVFKAMQPQAFFINIGRGASVVQDDLIAALKQGDIAAAALDVTDPEPLPEDSELWRLPNVLITPHISARSDQSMRRVWTLVRENLRRYVRGERMLNVVDIKRGY